jgi:nucleotide-binding universal stress UspA family protein
MASRKNSRAGGPRKVIAAVDGSEQSTKAVRAAAEMVAASGGEIVLLHVIEMREIPELIAEAEDEGLEDRAELVLGAAAKLASSLGVRARPVVRRGHVADQVLRFASSYRPDAIVIGSRGLSRVKRVLLGSVSHAVSLHAKCSVVIVR